MRSIHLLLFLLLAGCSSIPITTSTPTLTLGDTEMPALRYLALGDSYTIGEGVAAADRWPNQLIRSLEAEGMQMEVTIIAHTGWTVDDLWQGTQANPPTGTYDLVTLSIGANDQYRGYPASGYREDFSLMLQRAIEYAGGDTSKVIVLSIPDWGFTPFAAARDITLISSQIDEFNAINREETNNAGAHYVDVTDISRLAEKDPELIAGDQLHPSAKMYTLWTEKVQPIALEIVR